MTTYTDMTEAAQEVVTNMINDLMYVYNNSDFDFDKFVEEVQFYAILKTKYLTVEEPTMDDYDPSDFEDDPCDECLEPCTKDCPHHW